MDNVMKLVDDKSQTEYILYPERIREIQDNSTGCWISFAGSRGGVQIPNVSARKVKRSIQDRLEQSLGYLKAEYPGGGAENGVRYFNVDYIASVISHGTVDRNGTLIEVCGILMEDGGHEIKIDHPAHEVAYQVRRVIRRLDQDEEICCSPETETE